MTTVDAIMTGAGAGMGVGALLGAALRSDGMVLIIRGLTRALNRLRPTRPIPADFETLTDLQVQMSVAGWPKLAYLLGCPYCLGVYLSLAVTLAVQNCTDVRGWMLTWLTVYGVGVFFFIKTDTAVLSKGGVSDAPLD